MSDKRMKPIKAWGGFTEGKLHSRPAEDGYTAPGTQPAIYLSRKAARARYEDVRPVYITLSPEDGK